MTKDLIDEKRVWRRLTVGAMAAALVLVVMTPAASSMTASGCSEAIMADVDTLSSREDIGTDMLFKALERWKDACDVEQPTVTAQDSALGPSEESDSGPVDDILAQCHVTGELWWNWKWRLEVVSDGPPISPTVNDPHVVGYARRLGDGTEYGKAEGVLGTVQGVGHPHHTGTATFGPIGPVVGDLGVDPECEAFTVNTIDFGFVGTWFRVGKAEGLPTDDCMSGDDICVNLRASGVLCEITNGGCGEILPDEFEKYVTDVQQW